MVPLPLDPGQLNTRLLLEVPQETSDGQGGTLTQWVAVTEVWARIEPLVQGAVWHRQVELAGAERAVLSHRVTLRQRPDLRAGQRFRRGERVLTIRSLRDPDESGRFFLCDCEEVLL
ncbi:phage head closure protein [Rhizobium helianthi]|uniref:Phage head closure protein n=1 Tax=Rhizobium helianthi TaxID=1132695 RepID=A0ABW4M5C1_9HYPH